MGQRRAWRAQCSCAMFRHGPSLPTSFHLQATFTCKLLELHPIPSSPQWGRPAPAGLPGWQQTGAPWCLQQAPGCLPRSTAAAARSVQLPRPRFRTAALHAMPSSQPSSPISPPACAAATAPTKRRPAARAASALPATTVPHTRDTRARAAIWSSGATAATWLGRAALTATPASRGSSTPCKGVWSSAARSGSVQASGHTLALVASDWSCCAPSVATAWALPLPPLPPRPAAQWAPVQGPPPGLPGPGMAPAVPPPSAQQPPGLRPSSPVERLCSRAGARERSRGIKPAVVPADPAAPTGLMRAANCRLSVCTAQLLSSKVHLAVKGQASQQGRAHRRAAHKRSGGRKQVGPPQSERSAPSKRNGCSLSGAAGRSRWACCSTGGPGSQTVQADGPRRSRRQRRHQMRGDHGPHHPARGSQMCTNVTISGNQQGPLGAARRSDSSLARAPLSAILTDSAADRPVGSLALQQMRRAGAILNTTPCRCPHPPPRAALSTDSRLQCSAGPAAGHGHGWQLQEASEEPHHLTLTGSRAASAAGPGHAARVTAPGATV